MEGNKYYCKNYNLVKVTILILTRLIKSAIIQYISLSFYQAHQTLVIV